MASSPRDGTPAEARLIGDTATLLREMRGREREVSAFPV